MIRPAAFAVGTSVMLLALTGGISYASAVPTRPPLIVKFAPVDWAPGYSGLGAVTVNVEVTVDQNGDVIGVQMPKSTGIKALDLAALQAALKSSYAPAIKDCKPITGSVLAPFVWRPD